MSDSLWSYELQHVRLSCPSLSPGVCSNSCPLNGWCHPIISFSVAPFSYCPHSFPASGSFPMSWLVASGGQRIGALALVSVLPVNIQGWFPLGLTGLIPLLSKGLSRVFSRYVVGDGQPKEGQRGKHCKSLRIRKGYITSPRYWYKSIHLNNC